MMIVDAFGFFVDAVQRYSGLNIRFDDSVGAQLDISKDFSLFLLMIFVFLLDAVQHLVYFHDFG